MITFMVITTLICTIQNNLYISSINAIGNPPKVGVLLFNFNDPNISFIKQNLENIEKENPDKVRLSFYDAKDNQAIQNADIDNLINNNVDLLLVNLVDTKQSTILNIINKANSKNIPLIFFNTELLIPTNKAFGKVVIIATDSKLSGIMQGKTNNPAAINRTIHSISTLNDNGIKTEELALKICNWDRACAKDSINSLFLKYGGKIEAIIANNDAMAIGAIEALQAYGYNKGDKTKTIPVVGVDAIPEARELITKGFMTSTVIQDPKDFANALYSVGINLIYNRDPLEGTNYKFNTEGMIEIPYHEYTP